MIVITDMDLATRALRDPHFIERADEGAHAIRGKIEGTPTVDQFFRLWYPMVNEYETINAELRKVFSPRNVESFRITFLDMARERVAAMPAKGDLVRDYLHSYFLESTFWALGIPEEEWSELAAAVTLLIGLFTHSGLVKDEPVFFDSTMCYLKSLAEKLATNTDQTPFLRAYRNLVHVGEDPWSAAALIGHLLMAGTAPMTAGAAMACLNAWSDRKLLDDLRTDRVDTERFVMDTMDKIPPFGKIFRTAQSRCDCLGAPIQPGTVLVIDVAAVNSGVCPASTNPREHRGSSASITFGKGRHFCLGSGSARIQVASALNQLIVGMPDLYIVDSEFRIDKSGYVIKVESMPYLCNKLSG